MEEAEVPLEHLHEEVHHSAEHSRDTWISWVALSTAILAVLAKEAAAKSNFHKHEVFARGVTMFQIAIAVAAISALTKKRKFWIVSLIFGSVGCIFLVLAAIAR